MKSWIKSLISFVSGNKSLLARTLNLLYPQYCLSCNQLTEGVLCAACVQEIRRIDSPACFICGAPYVSAAATSYSPTHCCGDCRDDPPLFIKAITPYRYEGLKPETRGPVAALICQFKYQKQTGLADPLVELMIGDLRGVVVDRVVPIPLHPARLRLREFNQSLLLARAIAKRLGLPYSIDAMARIRETPPQVGLSRKERAANMKGVFAVTRINEIAGARILLVDDVYTTGATLREGAKALMATGAKAVTVVAVARMGATG